MKIETNYAIRPCAQPTRMAMCVCPRYKTAVVLLIYAVQLTTTFLRTILIQKIYLREM